jgi:hypothetical protein
VLVAPTTPFSTKTDDNPEGWPKEAIEAQHQLIARDFLVGLEKMKGRSSLPIRLKKPGPGSKT